MAIKKVQNKPEKASSQLHTDEPLSEKDEVKEAEERLNKKTDPSIAAELKSRKRDKR